MNRLESINKWEAFLFNKTLLGRLCILQMCLVGFSTPITSTIPYFLGVNSSPINITLNAIYLALAIYLIIGAATKTHLEYLSYGGWLIIIFWILYTTRIIYDTQIVGLRFKNSLFVFYSMAFGNCLLSTIAVIFTAKYIQLKEARRFFFLTLLISNLSILFLVFQEYGSLDPVVIAARVNFIVETESGSKSLLNPITTAFFGELLALLSMGCLLFFKNRFFVKCLYALATMIGVFVLILGASRGPMFSFLVLFVFLLLAHSIMARKTAGFYTRLVLIPVTILFLLAQFVLPKFQLEDVRVFARISDFIESRKSGEKESRDYQWEAAWEQFLEHPIIGDQFLEKHANFYPHNIYLESLMALGVIGGSLLFALVLYVLYRIFHQVVNRQKIIVFSIILLAIMLGNVFSGSLFGSFKFWQMTAFICSIPQREILAFSNE